MNYCKLYELLISSFVGCVWPRQATSFPSWIYILTESANDNNDNDFVGAMETK